MKHSAVLAVVLAIFVIFCAGCSDIIVSWPVTVTVDYSQSLDQMIEAGDYYHPDSAITVENFSLRGSGVSTVELKTINFGREVSTREVLGELDLRGLRPATIVELLVYGAEYPEEQRNFNIIALGSVWVRPSYAKDALVPYHYVPALVEFGGVGEATNKRGLVIENSNHSWHAKDRFLVIRK